MSEEFCRGLIINSIKKGQTPSWSLISRHGKLSEAFMREFWDKLDWGFIAEFQKLSEDFMREMRGKNDWLSLTQCQKMSDKFLEEFRNDIRWNARQHFFGVNKELYLKYRECFKNYD